MLQSWPGGEGLMAVYAGQGTLEVVLVDVVDVVERSDELGLQRPALAPSAKQNNERALSAIIVKEA